MSFSNLTIKGEDEKITNKLAVTSLLFRFKVIQFVPGERLVSGIVCFMVAKTVTMKNAFLQ